MINVEVVTCADTSNHVYRYGLPQKLISDAGSNLTTAFSWIRDSLDSIEVKQYLDQKGVKRCDLEQYPKGSLNRGIGEIVESGVALGRKLIQGSIRNNILEFQHFFHVIKESDCYANKRPLLTEALREQNPEDEFKVVSPEFLKFGYETAVKVICLGRNEPDDWMDVDSGVLREPKIIQAKERLRNNYH